MPNTTEGLLLIIGCFFLMIGLIGGGFEVSAAKIPPVGKKARIGSAIVGIALLVLAMRSISFRDVQATPPATAPKRDAGVLAGREETPSVPASRKNVATTANAGEQQSSNHEKGVPLSCPSVEGVWKSPAGVVVRIRQAECVVSAIAEDSQFTHAMQGTFDDGVFRVTTKRRNVSTACETRLFGFLKIVDSNHLQVAVDATDGRCDLATNYTESVVWAKI